MWVIGKSMEIYSKTKLKQEFQTDTGNNKSNCDTNYNKKRFVFGNIFAIDKFKKNVTKMTKQQTCEFPYLLNMDQSK